MPVDQPFRLFPVTFAAVAIVVCCGAST
jgi:hypothetical protein